MSVLISVVSHRQAEMVHHLLEDLQRFCFNRELEVIVTINAEESVSFKKKDFDYKIRIIRNKYPKGFGANHNEAFRLSSSDFFCIVNPDVRLIQDPFQLLTPLTADRRIGVIAPLTINRDQRVEDSARKLPTPGRLFRRILSLKRNDQLDYNVQKTLYPDWVAGIFMIFCGDVFKALKGFDEKFFLYFEDVDLCSRLRLAGYKIVLDPSVTVIHEARRDSHHHLQYLLWHSISGFKFFSSSTFWAVYLKGLRTNIEY